MLTRDSQLPKRFAITANKNERTRRCFLNGAARLTNSKTELENYSDRHKDSVVQHEFRKSTDLRDP